MAATTSAPLAWSRKKLFELVTIQSGQVDPKSVEYRDLPLIAPDHIEPSTGRLLKVETAAVQGAISGKYIVEPGDIVYSKIRPYLRKAYLAEFKALCSADMYPLRPKNGVDGKFIVNTLLDEPFTAFAASTSMRSGIPKINRVELAEFELLTPSSEEQVQIGAALSNADDLIAALERLIAKKRAIKQGMMQELLTGRTRLPGFTEPWGMASIGDLFAVSAGGDWDSANFTQIASPRNRFAVIANAMHSGAVQGWSPYFLTPGNALTISGRGDVGKAVFRKDPFVPIVRLLSLVPNCGDSARFYAEYWNYMVKLSLESTGVPQLTAPQVRPVEVWRPPLEEQFAIAGRLDGVDGEIEALERRLQKTRDIKQGMMQELLTGRTRLSVEEG